MKAPAKIRTYCPRCSKHTQHAVRLYKAGKRRVLAAGERRYRAKQRGYGGQKKPIQRRTAKLTKKQTLKLTCDECGHTLHKKGVRLSKLKMAT